MKLGIFGLPLCGKTTVFRILAGRRDLADARDEAQQAVVKLPDERLQTLVGIYHPAKVSPAEIVFVDTVSVQKGSKGRSASYSEMLKDADGWALVVRCFDTMGDDPAKAAIDDLESLTLEMALTDLAIIERRLERLEKDLRRGKREAAAESEVLSRCAKHLEAGGLLRQLDLEGDDEKAIRGYPLLTMKPMLVVVNVSAELAGQDALEDGLPLAEFRATCEKMGFESVAFCAELEAEIQELDPAEQAEFLADYGIEEPARESFIRKCFGLLGLVTFFTGGPTEVHAWMVPAGSTVVEAAGKIHTDLARGFIRAEVIALDDLVDAGSEAQCRARGTSRLEGKTYEVREADVVLVRYSV